MSLFSRDFGSHPMACTSTYKGTRNQLDGWPFRPSFLGFRLTSHLTNFFFRPLDLC